MRGIAGLLGTERQVFFDPSGRRGRRLTGIGAALAFTLVLLSFLFFLSLLAAPFLPAVGDLKTTRARTAILPDLPDHEDRLSRYLLQQAKQQLFREITKRKHQTSVGYRGETVVAAFYSVWRVAGLSSLNEAREDLTHLFPEWLHLNPSGTGFTTRDWDPTLNIKNLEVVRICREEKIKILPVINNAEGGEFRPERVSRLLRSPKNRTKLIADLRDFVLKEQFHGINIDFENLYRKDYDLLVLFMQELSAEFRKHDLLVTIDVELNRPEIPIRQLAEQADFVIPMAYDEHYSGGEPGPIASAPWLYNSLREFAEHVPPEKTVLGIACYAYDWPEHGPAEALSFQTALHRAHEHLPEHNRSSFIRFDPDALNPYFRYIDEDGKERTVWFLDASTAFNQMRVGREFGFRGTALWVLGAEDPAIWHVLRKPESESPDGIDVVRFPHRVEYEGDGEILYVASMPADGHRTITMDPNTSLITDVRYEDFPSSYVIKRSGYREKFVALTFDDGPHPKYTKKILDLLKFYGVKGTFFVIGQNAERYPDLIQRAYAEGHLIGNHTFTHPNMSRVNEQRARLELNTTQRSIQSLLKRSTVLFRPPYHADAEPETSEEVDPLLIASDLGYVTVGELIDPQDWNLYRKLKTGETVPRSSADLLESILYQLGRKKGNVILLHDGGGERRITVETLAILIPLLKERGYTFGTVADLLDQRRDDLMPTLRDQDRMIIGYDRFVFEVLFFGELILGGLFILAVVLGIGRVLIVLLLALLALIRDLRHPSPIMTAATGPTVTVLVAAYNEGKVIARTMESLMKSRYAIKELIVIDDGSTDDTLSVARQALARIEGPKSKKRRIRILHQENAGKSAALNHGIEYATGDVLVCLDADTIAAPDAIGRLVAHFSDERVGGVAGNIKVGNRNNLLTKWQAIEYITSQNLDRRAGDLVNAVTVIPGALGAWRASAVREAGGFVTDTLAEDMDLTWRLRRAGYRMVNEGDAIGYTEVPDTYRSFIKQRMRWSFGSLQCLYKHRSALFRYGWFGRFALPSLWIFQFLFQVIAPLVDIQILFLAARFLNAYIASGLHQQDWQPLHAATADLLQFGFLYLLLFAVELLGAIIAFRLDRERLRALWSLPLQRILYRQILYLVIYHSLWKALSGMKQSWNKLQRRGNVQAA